ncbi:uncharacterized protein SPSK_07539 [Sporothrix schenckii 1099-18]|uniref:Trafficking protein particle complex subunit 12 n=2 Tax=Sporothrix schenckii TaxID=29908 RepID=U7Q1V1_SPOS1|nr:uncharacterized protein SPSK_07539 [Sporothrix schenckii 1099-18]ERT00686.1 hypothetical protein HMPREF1624_01916 [Sporothrix schenckii ATCC 58251]KJR87759.1 hypothetical protein SPSK_07539 [Sporothrix schenckii 1099-18]
MSQSSQQSPPPSRGGGGGAAAAGLGLSIDAAVSGKTQAQRAPSPRPKDFIYLLRPEIYHPLPATAAGANVPQSFRISDRQPNPDEAVGAAELSATALSDLLASGHFRAAAIVAARQLVAQPDPTDYARIFSLFYTRLACLLLLDMTSLAAQEAKALEDLNSPFYRGEADPNDPSGLPPHLAPWALRVLHVRLQALGFGDPRRAVMSYYELAREARVRIAAALATHDNSVRELWKARLSELGIQVAGALIEMDDMAGAAAHLANLSTPSSASSSSSPTTTTATLATRRIDMAKALLWLQLGDVDAARAAMGRDGASQAAGDDTADSPFETGKSGDAGDLAPRVVAALCDMADGEYRTALAAWRALRDDAPDDEMIGVNLAVCLLYVGQMQEGRAVLEGLVDAGYSSHTLLFNLSTMYELCTDRAKAMKLNLAQRVADQTHADGQAWEKTNADFKL